MLRLAYRSVAPLVVVPVQDLLELGFGCPAERARFCDRVTGSGGLTREELDLLEERESAAYLAEQAKITGQAR